MKENINNSEDYFYRTTDEIVDRFRDRLIRKAKKRIDRMLIVLIIIGSLTSFLVSMLITFLLG